MTPMSARKIHNIDAYRAAKGLIKSFGDMAATVAIARAMRAFQEGDRSRFAQCRHVVEEIRAWQAA